MEVNLRKHNSWLYRPCFEPIDEFKGDIARMYFYFATRYENTVAGYNYAMFNNSTNKVLPQPFEPAASLA
jgi:endonuclease I